MMRSITLLVALSVLGAVDAYWLMGINNVLTVQRMDPIVNPNTVSGHAHAILGGSNFDINLSTDKLLKSECTTIPIKEDKSNYWYPQLYFQWANGSFSSVDGGAVIYYLFDDKPGTTTAFPPDFRMLSGDPTLRSYDANSFAQQAIEFLCLDFNGVTTKHTSLPEGRCPSGIRSHVNFPNCWDGVNLDSPNHKSHVAFSSDGPNRNSCRDPNFPVVLPRIFLEVYWGTGYFDNVRSQAMNPNQPFVFAHGDPTGFGNHADFFNGWEPGVLQRAVDGCTCNIYGSFDCCVDKGLFTVDKDAKCYVTNTFDEQTMGTLPKLPGNNPVQPGPGRASMYKDSVIPGVLSPVRVYRDQRNAPPRGNVVTPPQTVGEGSSPPVSTPAVTTTSTPTSTTAPTSTATPTVLPTTVTTSSANTAAPTTTSTPTIAPPLPPYTDPATTTSVQTTSTSTSTSISTSTGAGTATGSPTSATLPPVTVLPTATVLPTTVRPLPTATQPPVKPSNPVTPPAPVKPGKPHHHGGKPHGGKGQGGKDKCTKKKQKRALVDSNQFLTHRRRLTIEEHFF